MRRALAVAAAALTLTAAAVALTATPAAADPDVERLVGMTIDADGIVYLVYEVPNGYRFVPI